MGMDGTTDFVAKVRRNQVAIGDEAQQVIQCRAVDLNLLPALLDEVDQGACAAWGLGGSQRLEDWFAGTGLNGLAGQGSSGWPAIGRREAAYLCAVHLR